MTTADRPDLQTVMRQALVEARILRDTLDTQEALARAWDQGWDAGHSLHVVRNPYREATP